MEGFISQIIYSEAGNVEVFKTKTGFMFYSGEYSQALMQQAIDVHVVRFRELCKVLMAHYIDTHNLSTEHDLKPIIKELSKTG